MDWLGLAGVLSIAAHAIALAAFLVAASWRIEKLSHEERVVFVAPGMGIPLSGPSEEPARPVDPPRHKPKAQRRARDLVQPAPPVAVEPVAVEPVAVEPVVDQGIVAAPNDPGLFHCPPGSACLPAGLAAIAETPMCGDGRVDAGEECDDGGRINYDGCSGQCTRERIAVVDSRVIEGYRVAGDPQIHPPVAIRDQMVEDRVLRTIGMVKMCLDPDGAVAALQLLRSTGYKAYDDLLTARMRTWRYRPYVAGGKPVAACTKVAFIYKIEFRPIRREGIR